MRPAAAGHWMQNLRRRALPWRPPPKQIVSRRYQGALATYLDVLSAEDELITAQRSQAELQTRALILDVALVRALGGGFTPATLNARS